MTWWETEHWKAYERAYGDEPGTRVRELAEATWLTHVVDLTQSEEELWRKIPKTMRQAVEKGEMLAIAKTEEHLFWRFVVAHQKAGGTRRDATYECQREWLSAGHALCWCAFDGSEALVLLGAILVIRYRGWAYYASGPSSRPHVMPALIWTAMKECKRLGDRWFEVGWLKGDTEKERSIAKFKARWGGENKPANWLAMEAVSAPSA